MKEEPVKNHRRHKTKKTRDLSNNQPQNKVIKQRKNITGSYTEVHLELNGSQKTLQGSRWQYIRLMVKFDNPETMQLFLYFNQFKIFH